MLTLENIVTIHTWSSFLDVLEVCIFPNQISKNVLPLHPIQCLTKCTKCQILILSLLTLLIIQVVKGNVLNHQALVINSKLGMVMTAIVIANTKLPHHQHHVDSHWYGGSQSATVYAQVKLKHVLMKRNGMQRHACAHAKSGIWIDVKERESFWIKKIVSVLICH